MSVPPAESGPARVAAAERVRLDTDPRDGTVAARSMSDPSSLSKVRIGVVVPAYRVARHIEAAFESAAGFGPLVEPDARLLALTDDANRLLILADAEERGFDVPELIGLSLVVLLAVILVRICWVYFTAVLSRWQARVAARRLKQLDARLDALPPRARPERAVPIERPALGDRVSWENRRQRFGMRRNRQSFAERMEQVREARRQGGFDLLPPFTWRQRATLRR